MAVLGRALALALAARGVERYDGMAVAASIRAGRGFKGTGNLGEERVTRRAGSSGRMVNLRLQAERGVTAVSSLDDRGSLLDYDYQPDGLPLPTKPARVGQDDRAAAGRVCRGGGGPHGLHPVAAELRAVPVGAAGSAASRKGSGVVFGNTAST